MSNKKAPQKKLSEGTQALIVCLAAVAVMIIALTIVLVATSTPEAPSTETEIETGAPVDMTAVQAEINAKTTYDFVPSNEVTEYVRLTVKGMGDIVIRLRSDAAPLTVQNFQKLVKEGFYDGLIFHRVIKNFMIQGGSGETAGKTASNVKGEFASNGVSNNFKHVRGVISMARVSGQNNSASSQFFICDATNASTQNLDGDYAAFGYVVAGMGVVDAIASVEVSGSAQSPRPVNDVIIEKAIFVTPGQWTPETTQETQVATDATTEAETTVDTSAETEVDTTVDTSTETEVDTTVDTSAETEVDTTAESDTSATA